MVGDCSSREWGRGNARSNGSNGSSRGGEASVGDHGECDLSSPCGTLNDGSSPWTTRGNELAWQELNRLEGRSSCSRKLAGDQLYVELLRLRRRILGTVTCLVDDLLTWGYRIVGRGQLWSRQD